MGKQTEDFGGLLIGAASIAVVSASFALGEAGAVYLLYITAQLILLLRVPFDKRHSDSPVFAFTQAFLFVVMAAVWANTQRLDYLVGINLVLVALVISEAKGNLE